MNLRARLTPCVALVALVALGGLGGCSGAPEPSSEGGAGGKTTCGEFTPLNTLQREAVVTKMMRDRGQETPEVNVRLLAIQVDFFCTNVTASDTIDGVYAG